MEKAKTAEEKIIDDLFGKHLHPDSQSCCGITFDHVAAMKEYGQMCAEQARKEERDKIKSEMENLKFTAEDMAVFADWYSMNWDIDFKPDAALKQWLEERRENNDKTKWPHFTRPYERSRSEHS